MFYDFDLRGLLALQDYSENFNLSSLKNIKAKFVQLGFLG